MPHYSDYFAWLAHGDWIRVSARAIILNTERTRTLLERNFADTGEALPFVNFIGGGVETGETLQECLAREIAEETGAQIVQAQYLFVVENFIPHQGQVRHAHDHFFVLTLDREIIRPVNSNVEYLWVALAELKKIDVRPTVVRDCLADGTYPTVRRLQIGKT